jgi:hypothetical protein
VALSIAAWACLSASSSAAAPPGGSASASGSGVAVIRPPVGDSVLEEASLRIRSELDAAGTSNRLIDCSGPGNPEPHDCPDSSAVARIALFREEGVATLQVLASLPDGLELRRHVRVPAEAGGSDPAVLAVRAVELLRDLYLDIPRVARRPTPTAAAAKPNETRATAAAAPAEPVLAGSAFLGGGVVQGRWGLNAAPGPSVGVGVAIRSRLRLLASVAGPFQTRVGPSGAEADTWQTLLSAQARYEIGHARVRPFVLAGAGVFLLRAGSQKIEPSPLVAVGLGVAVRLLPWLALTLDVQEVVTLWILEVKAGADVVGRAGGPSELVQGGLLLTTP